MLHSHYYIVYKVLLLLLKFALIYLSKKIQNYFLKIIIELFLIYWLKPKVLNLVYVMDYILFLNLFQFQLNHLLNYIFLIKKLKMIKLEKNDKNINVDFKNVQIYEFFS